MDEHEQRHGSQSETVWLQSVHSLGALDAWRTWGDGVQHIPSEALLKGRLQLQAGDHLVQVLITIL